MHANRDLFAAFRRESGRFLLAGRDLTLFASKIRKRIFFVFFNGLGSLSPVEDHCHEPLCAASARPSEPRACTLALTVITILADTHNN